MCEWAGGVVKWYNFRKGYGCIEVEGRSDHYFRKEDLNNLINILPKEGDAVVFESHTQRLNEPVAKKVSRTGLKKSIKKPTSEDAYRAEVALGIDLKKPAKKLTPQGAYREEVVQHGHSRLVSTGVGTAIGAALGGPVGAIILGGVGAAVKSKDKVTRIVEITSTCIKCNGQGRVTTRVDERTGFKCRQCGNFWKVPDRKMPEDDLNELKRQFP